jgi:hypothetical protein
MGFHVLARCGKVKRQVLDSVTQPSRSAVQCRDNERPLGDGNLWEHRPRATSVEAHAAVAPCDVTITLSFRCLSRMQAEFIIGR